MSFVYNENLLDEFETIIKKFSQQNPQAYDAARREDEANRVDKEQAPRAGQQAGQQANQQTSDIARNESAAEFTNPKRLQRVALEALEHLKAQYSRLQSGNSISLLPKDLISVPAFLTWLNANGTTIDGKKVVIPAGDPTTKLADPKYDMIGNFAVWKEGLIGAVKELQDKALQSNDQYFVEHVNHLVSMVNGDQQFASNLEEKSIEKATNQTIPQSNTQTQENSNKQQQATQPGQQAMQPVQLQQTQQTEQNIQSLKEISQQVSGSPIPTLPFNLNTNQFDIGLIEEFSRVMDAFLRQDFIRKELYSYWSGIRSAIGQLGNSLSSWNSIGAKMDAFPLNSDVDGFVTDVANKDYGKARDMLVLIGTICRTVNSILSTLLASQSLTEQFGNQASVDAQRNKAINFAAWTESMISKINSMAKR